MAPYAFKPFMMMSPPASSDDVSKNYDDHIYDEPKIYEGINHYDKLRKIEEADKK